VLAAVARRLLPREIAERHKHGLGYPKDVWRKPSLTPYARQLLLDSAAGGPFVRSTLERNLTRWLDRGAPRGALTSLVFLQSWWNEFLGAGSPYR